MHNHSSRYSVFTSAIFYSPPPPPTARQKITFEFLAQNVEVSFPTNGPVDIFHVFEQVTFVSARCCMFEKIILLFVSIVIEFGARLSKFYLLEEG